MSAFHVDNGIAHSGLAACDMSDITHFLLQIESGDSSAADKLLPLVYNELRKLASVKLLQEKAGQTLQATALVHEAYLRLLGTNESQPSWESRGHFFAAAAEAMRRILVDQARHKSSLKRGGNWQRRDLAEVDLAIPEPPDDLLALDDALRRFEQHDPLKAKLVKMRYFVGLSIPDSAAALGISSATADRYWSYARAWLHTELAKGGDSQSVP